MLILPYKRRPKMFIQLYKVQENEKYWIFFFRDLVHQLGQAVIVPKEATWEGMEDAWDTMWEKMTRTVLERQS